MRRSLVAISAVALAAFAACAESGDSQQAAAAADSSQQQTMAEWLRPTPGELPRRSDEEKKLGTEIGRPLPTPEFLQPPLDGSLKPFAPTLDPDTSGSFIGGASDILPSLVHSWIAAFNRYYPNVNIEIGTPYAGSLGMLEVIEGNYDFVFVSRELKPTDITLFTEKYGYPPLSVPISGAAYRHYGFLDAIGFFVHVDNPLDRLTYQQIDSLFSSTRHHGGEPITTWGELGLQGEWANRTVNLYGVAPWNGFEEFVRQRVLSVDERRGEWRDGIDFSKTAFPIAEKVASDPQGIGYTGLAYVTAGVKMLPLSTSGEAGSYIPPTYERVADATYPLSRLIYFNVNRAPDEPLNPILHEFLRFVLSREGQQLVLDHAIFVPLRSSQANESLGLLDQGRNP